MRKFQRCGAHFQPLALFIVESILVGCGESAELQSDEQRPSMHEGVVSPDEQSEIVAPNRFLLFANFDEPPQLTLSLDKREALKLFGLTWSQKLRLLDVDSTKLLENVLAMIRDACGTSWKMDRLDPAYDCPKTALGRSLGSNWRASPEFALVRLLGTTPANASANGTSLEDFATLVNKNPATFRFDFAQVLADTLGIRRTDPIVPLSDIVRSLQRNLVGSYPGVMNETGRLPVSLHDALLDLQPLADKLGPRGTPPYLNRNEHPGILQPDDGTFRTRSNALSPDFRMRVTARSNLRRVEGIQFGSGAGDMFISLGSAPLSFDFEDARAFVVQGIVDEPTIDIRLAIEEAPWEQACAADPQCRPYFLASIVRDAAKGAYSQREYHHCHVSFAGGCLVGIDIAKQNGQAGFTTFTNSIRNVKTPPPQFLWDLLTDVALVQLHDPNGDGVPDITQGKARSSFTLRGVPLGIRGSDLVQQMRPVLQSQEQEIAEIIVGKYWQHNDDLDAFVMPGPSADRPYLFFVAPSDKRTDPMNIEVAKPYQYRRPGFFSRADLSESSRLSRRTIPEFKDTEHEKLALEQGSQVVYVEDAQGNVHELTIFVPEVPEDGAQTFPIEIAVKHMGKAD